MNLISKIILKIMDKFPQIRKDIEESFQKEKGIEEDIEYESTDKEIEKDIEYESIDKENEFNKVCAGDVIWSTTPDFKNNDKSHLIRPYLVIGRNKNMLYALYGTTKKHYEEPEYYGIKLSRNKEESYFYCCNITKLDINNFKSIYTMLSDASMNAVYKKIINNTDCLKYIDKRFLDTKREKAAIIMCNKQIYIIININKNNDKYKVVELVPGKASHCVHLFGQDFIANNQNIITLDKNNPIIAIKTDIDYYNYLLKIHTNNKQISYNEYNFADILSIKGTKEKVIYLYHTDKDVYYVPFTTLEIFSGINKLNINKIEGVYGSLSYSDIAKLVNKLDSKLANSNGKHIDKNIEKQIIKQYKKR